MNADPISFLNSAIFNFDLFLFTGSKENLEKANENIVKYRELGGNLYHETEKKIKEYLDNF